MWAFHLGFDLATTLIPRCASSVRNNLYSRGQHQFFQSSSQLPLSVVHFPLSAGAILRSYFALPRPQVVAVLLALIDLDWIVSSPVSRFCCESLGCARENCHPVAHRDPPLVFTELNWLPPCPQVTPQTSVLEMPAPAAPSSVKPSAQDHVGLPQPLLPSYQQGVAMDSGPLPSAASNVASTMDLPPMLSHMMDLCCGMPNFK
jgi:hypothetical protein